MDKIVIKGAKEHNLANINLVLPKNKLIVFTGVSGSGKTSLALDILFTEGQRRFVESLSSYARQFLGPMRKPAVDKIEGLTPAIAIDQKALSHNPRSTVGTVTEIYDYLRVLFARVGHPHCPKCGREVAPQTSISIRQQIIKLIQDTLAIKGKVRLLILAPIVREKKGEFNKLWERLAHKGFNAVRIDGRFYSLDEEIFLLRTNRHNIDVVVDRIAVVGHPKSWKQLEKRVQDGVEIALDLSAGLVIVGLVEDPTFEFPARPQQITEILFSRRFACPTCNFSLPQIEPRLFSFNSPQGACPECSGLGIKLRIDTSRIPSWRAKILQHRYLTTTSDVIRQEIEKFMIKKECPACRGARLRPEALAVTVAGLNIAQVSNLPLTQLANWLKTLPSKLASNKEKQVAHSLQTEILTRTQFLIDTGVGYLTLARTTATLSAGEAQRIRLASQIGTRLSGVLYVLDEPTVGLHPRDTNRLIKTLFALKKLGNTVVVVEHDQTVIESADWLVEFGPGAGKEGGQIVAEGTVKQVKNNPASLTGQYLSGKKQIPKIGKPKIPNRKTHWLTIVGCRHHNLKNITVRFPLGHFICLVGVSGSGKSTLLHDTLYPALRQKLTSGFNQKPGEFDKLEGEEFITRVLMVDQSPIGKTSRSNPATYIGVFTDIRRLFAQTKEARLRGLTPSHFSFNVPGGRCEACAGQGQIRVQMQFLPDVWVICEECQGKRFKPEVLEVEYKEKNIAQVLELTVKEARAFFNAIPSVVKKLQILEQIGLGYLQLGQGSPTLSGGEAQRLKIARELVKGGSGHTLYLLDEPTTGLHFADLEKLLWVLRQLVNRGNTVVVIEHHPEVIRQADWVIELGPEGGEAGGYLIAEGPPKALKQNPNSITGKFL